MFCRYLWCTRTCIPDGMEAWRGRAGVQDLPLAYTLPFASALDLLKPRLLCLGFPFCLPGESVRYHCECSVFGLKCMGLDLFAGGVHGLGCWMIHFSLRMWLCPVFREEGPLGSFWHVCGVVGLLRAVLVSWQPHTLLKRSSQKSLPVVCALALSMTKTPSSRESYSACRITSVFSFAYWPVKKGKKKHLDLTIKKVLLICEQRCVNPQNSGLRYQQRPNVITQNKCVCRKAPEKTPKIILCYNLGNRARF